jgi:hypothetical protein
MHPLGRLTPSATRLRRQYIHVFAAAACVGPFLSYVLADLAWTPREIGYATAALTTGAVITAPLWGRLDDAWRGGAARLGLVATSVTAVGLVLALAGSSRWFTWAAVALFGAASGSLEALLTTRALREAGAATRLGAIRAAGSVGWIVGLGAGALLLTVTHQPVLVFLIAAAAAMSAPRRRGGNGSMGGRPRAQFPVRAVLGVLSITFPVPLCMAVLVFFTAGWAYTDLGAGPLLAVGPLALAAALELPALVLTDRLRRAVSSETLAALAFPPLAAAALALALVPGQLTLFAVQPLVALSFALWFVAQSRLVAERSPSGALASAQTLVSAIGRGAAGPLAGIAGGAIAAAGGYRSLFFTMAALCALGGLRAAVARRHTPITAGG